MLNGVKRSEVSLSIVHFTSLCMPAASVRDTELQGILFLGVRQF